jgi:predicted peptidase
MKLPCLLAMTGCLGLAITSAKSADATVTNQQTKTFRREITRTLDANYLLFLPKGYNSGAEARWPLILFLHGAGERGTNLNLVTVHGPPKIVLSNPEFRFIVVSPQCPPGQTWSDEVLLSLLGEISKEYRVDESRVYLTGLSMGGFGTWSLGLKHPDRFAAIAPICGGGDVLPLLLPDPAVAKRLKQLPVWAFHGGKDTAVKLEESERMVSELKRLGNPAKLTVYPDAGHDSWTQTYNDPALYDWFLDQQNPLVSPDGTPASP